MRSWSRFLAFPSSLLLALLVSQPAGALVVPFQGTIEVDIAGLITSFSGAGFATIDDGDAHVSSIQFTSGAWQTTALVLPVTDPGAAPIRGVQITGGNGPGNFAENGGGTLVGTMPILGAAKVCLFGPCSAAVANLVVPLSAVGVGGSIAATGPVNVTVHGAPWTTGTTAAVFPYTPFITTRMGARHGPASMTSSTAAPGGMIQLVTPFTVDANLTTANPYTYGFVRTTLHFVPEPATLALLAGGFVWLGVRARRRRLTS